ncbi:MAG TPA: type IV toxin-antitoxin system AbiEi family antitoxin domain-containing protein [Jiangellaceae bacterium]
MPNPADDLPRDVRELLRRNRGVLLAADAKQAGLSEARLRRLTAAGKLRRLTHGAYVDAKAFGELDEWQRFMSEARAFALLCGPGSFLTGWGCAAVRDFPTLGPPPRLATVVRPKDGSRKQFTGTGGRVVVANLPPEHRWHLGRPAGDQ